MLFEVYALDVDMLRSLQRSTHAHQHAATTHLSPFSTNTNMKKSRESFDLYTWGHGGQGALANSAFRDELEPYLVSSLRAHGGSILVSCGFDHTVCVTGDLRARVSRGACAPQRRSIASRAERGCRRSAAPCPWGADSLLSANERSLGGSPPATG